MDNSHVIQSRCQVLRIKSSESAGLTTGNGTGSLAVTGLESPEPIPLIFTPFSTGLEALPVRGLSHPHPVYGYRRYAPDGGTNWQPNVPAIHVNHPYATSGKEMP